MINLTIDKIPVNVTITMKSKSSNAPPKYQLKHKVDGLKSNMFRDDSSDVEINPFKYDVNQLRRKHVIQPKKDTHTVRLPERSHLRSERIQGTKRIETKTPELYTYEPKKVAFDDHATVINYIRKSLEKSRRQTPYMRKKSLPSNDELRTSWAELVQDYGHELPDIDGDYERQNGIATSERKTSVLKKPVLKTPMYSFAQNQEARKSRKSRKSTIKKKVERKVAPNTRQFSMKKTVLDEQPPAFRFAEPDYTPYNKQTTRNRNKIVKEKVGQDSIDYTNPFREEVRDSRSRYRVSVNEEKRQAYYRSKSKPAIRKKRKQPKKVITKVYREYESYSDNDYDHGYSSRKQQYKRKVEYPVLKKKQKVTRKVGHYSDSSDNGKLGKSDWNRYYEFNGNRRRPHPTGKWDNGDIISWANDTPIKKEHYIYQDPDTKANYRRF